MKIARGVRRAVGLFAIGALMSVAPVRGDQPNIAVQTPFDGETYSVGQTIHVHWTHDGDPSSSARVTVYLALSSGPLISATMTPTRNSGSVDIVAPAASDPAFIIFNYSDPPNGEFDRSDRTISIQ